MRRESIDFKDECPREILQINDYWNPRISGELNDSYIKMVKVKGEFIWHHHDDEDEMFLYVKGSWSSVSG